MTFRFSPWKFGKLNRRKFLIGSLLAAPAVVFAEADLMEPQWIKTRTLRLGARTPTHRVVQFSDIHHKGDKAFFGIGRGQNQCLLSPDFVCFTGDLVEDKEFTTETLAILKKIKAPIAWRPWQSRLLEQK